MISISFPSRCLLNQLNAWQQRQYISECEYTVWIHARSVSSPLILTSVLNVLQVQSILWLIQPGRKRVVAQISLYRRSTIANGDSVLHILHLTSLVPYVFATCTISQHDEAPESTVKRQTNNYLWHLSNLFLDESSEWLPGLRE